MQDNQNRQHDIDEVLRDTKGDHAHTMIKAALSAIPFAGGPIAELFGKYVPSPYQKRWINFITSIDLQLKELQLKRSDLTPELLVQNEAFLTVLYKAADLSLKTHREEKRKALRNIVLNSALSSEIDDDERQMFLSYLDEFTAWDLKILQYLGNIEVQKDSEGRLRKVGSTIIDAQRDLEAVYPDLNGRTDFLDQIIWRLSTHGFLSDTISEMPIELDKRVFKSFVTPMGKRFLSLISDPANC